MNGASRILMLARLEVRLVGRDRFLLGVGLYIVAMSLVIRFLLPGIESGLADSRGFDLNPYYPLLNSYFAVFLAPMLAGMIYGFTLLEAREDGTLRAVLVSPMPLTEYVRYRLLAPFALSAILVPALALLVGASLPGPLALLAISLVSALLGPVWALSTATFADDKISAFALLKALSGTGLILIGSFFVDEPLQLIAGAYPPFWLAKAYWVAVDGGPWWGYLAVGLLLLLAANVFLARRLARVAHR
ncbi:MAG: hypothetical protein OEU54_09375 [Gemmatimonadota bacterium]|nr:hypothetical protein [Gemmatimonadota bacterium]